MPKRPRYSPKFRAQAPGEEDGKSVPEQAHSLLLSQEATLYRVPFNPSLRPVYWFHNTLCADCWSRPHVHAWGELAYVAQGSIVICTESGNWLASPQRAIWIPAGCRHEWYVPCEARDLSLWIDQSLFVGVERFSRCHVLEISPLVREILLYLSPQPSLYGDDKWGRLVSALLDLLRDLPVISRPLAMPRDHRLVELCTALLAAPGDDSTLSQWAERLGMSERTIGRLFRRETGTSFRNWRQFQRMQAAHIRLRQGESVTSVALDCGYSSVSAFIATFKEHFGFTPGKATPDRHDSRFPPFPEPGRAPSDDAPLKGGPEHGVT